MIITDLTIISAFRNKLKRQVREHYKKMNQDIPVSIIFQALNSKIKKEVLKFGFNHFVLLLEEKV